MLFIIEGGDGTGKSTFADRLNEHIPNAKRLHCGPPTQDPLREYLDLDWYAPGSGQHVICDRWHIGETIYGPLYRGESALTRQGYFHVELYLRAKGALLVHLDNQDQVIYDRIFAEGSRGEDFLDKMHVTTVLANYRKRVRDTLLQTLRFVDPDEDSVDWALSVARRTEKRCAKLAQYSTYVGFERPQILLIGEKRGPGQMVQPLQAPCFVPYPATSGHYLLSSLLSVNLRRIGLANALEEDLKLLSDDLSRPKTVALGRSADRELERLGIDHGTVPHPQFVRRFYNRRGLDYGHLILQAAERQEDLGHWPR